VSPGRRTSKRLAGVHSDGTYIDEERGGRFTIANDNACSTTTYTTTEPMVVLHDDEDCRINDGSSLSMEQALLLAKTLPGGHAVSLPETETFVRTCLASNSATTTTASSMTDDEVSNNNQQESSTSYSLVKAKSSYTSTVSKKSATNTAALAMVPDLTVSCVHKVVPDRIYSVAVHSAMDQLVVAAGDKQGHVGLWNVQEQQHPQQPSDNADTTSNNNVHLFRVHTSPTCCLEWNARGNLISSSYDGTIRVLDVASETFTAVFGCTQQQKLQEGQQQRGNKNNSTLWYTTSVVPVVKNKNNFWCQYITSDHRFENCFFVSTSIGTAMHVDLRDKGRVTFDARWSEKKINTLR
jgi:hypothetical protein